MTSSLTFVSCVCCCHSESRPLCHLVLATVSTCRMQQLRMSALDDARSDAGMMHCHKAQQQLRRLLLPLPLPPQHPPCLKSTSSCSRSQSELGSSTYPPLSTHRHQQPMHPPPVPQRDFNQRRGSGQRCTSTSMWSALRLDEQGRQVDDSGQVVTVKREAELKSTTSRFPTATREPSTAE